jgi:hypothetical protein
MSIVLGVAQCSGVIIGAGVRKGFGKVFRDSFHGGFAIGSFAVYGFAIGGFAVYGFAAGGPKGLALARKRTVQA